jgi:release factor glutamine methyltransferase
MMTIQDALTTARAALGKAPTASRDAQILLCTVLDVSTGILFAYPERELTPEQISAYQALIARRAKGEPLAYMLGEVGFYDRDFYVTSDVLIPRPETEHLVELALTYAAGLPRLVAADIGTGSGAIAITVAAHAPHAEVHAVDVSPVALAVARRNAERHQVRINFHEGSLAEPLIAVGLRVNLLMANLPYIASSEIPTLEVSRHEPVLALDGGADGLRLIETLLRQVPQMCAPDACILLEIGAAQGAAARNLAQSLLQPRDVTVLPDYAGLDRIVKIIL